MSRRRSLSAFLFATTLLADVAPAVDAEKPSVGSGPRLGGRQTLTPLLPGPSPKVDRTTASVPGANGKLVYVHAFYGSWPESLIAAESNGTDAGNITGGTGQGPASSSWSSGGTMIAYAGDTDFSNAASTSLPTGFPMPVGSSSHRAGPATAICIR